MDDDDYEYGDDDDDDDGDGDDPRAALGDSGPERLADEVEQFLRDHNRDT
jgi:hypothetical protein